MLIAGGQDAEAAAAVSFRYRDGSSTTASRSTQAITEITDAIRDRVQV